MAKKKKSKSTSRPKARKASRPKAKTVSLQKRADQDEVQSRGLNPMERRDIRKQYAERISATNDPIERNELRREGREALKQTVEA